jgi:hypothetical protein
MFSWYDLDMNKNAKIIIITLVIIILVLGYLAFKPKNVQYNDYIAPEVTTENNHINTPTAPQTTSAQVNPPKPVTTQTQASWFIPNQVGWSEHTLTWKTYSTGDVSFNYPSGYVVETKKQEMRQGIYYDETTIKNPNSRSETDDTIYVGIPYVGANDPYTIYDVKENINNTGLTLSVRKDASNYAKYIFNNIAASATKNP